MRGMASQRECSCYLGDEDALVGFSHTCQCYGELLVKLRDTVCFYEDREVGCGGSWI